ncbi:MAG: arginine--tRNA ligase, partial [Candidatus Omnitrophica bacterium]|nr:arginine--tRNA ligase [Candidatus Omnitrophota bacterium]
MYYGGIEKEVVLLVESSLKEVLADLKAPAAKSHETIPALEIPKERSHGDISTNIAMRLVRLSGGRSPVDFAELIANKMRGALASSGLKGDIEKIEVKPPGFINFFLSSGYLYKVLLDIEREKDNYGRTSICRDKKIQLEFVSANPTGPLTIAHGRQAAIGDSLANILAYIGCEVSREYYVNDEGSQMNTLGHSIRARYRALCGIKEEFPPDGYKGTYVYDIAGDFKDKYDEKYVEEDIKAFREFGLKWILDDIKKDLKDFAVDFDVWYSQKALRDSGKIDEALELIKDKGYVFVSEGATWFRSTEFGDDKDRVLIKSDGSYTYLAPDIAYHLDKYRRGFKSLIDIWGPDHHGYIPRIKAAIQALGFEKDSLSVIIAQLATLYKGGLVVKMSTRAGEFVTLREVMDEVGKDVARFAFLMRKVSSHLDFDLDKVKEQSMENPVYYIQYAHARIWSMLEFSKDANLSSKFKSGLLKEEEELWILRLLRQFPLVIIISANS